MAETPRPCRGERGSVTAEFATAVPAVLLVLACCLAGLQLGAQQVRLQDAASTTARSLARGEAAPATGARVTTRTEGALLCARLEAAAGGVLPLMLSAEGCALAGGR